MSYSTSDPQMIMVKKKSGRANALGFRNEPFLLSLFINGKKRFYSSHGQDGVAGSGAFRESNSGPLAPEVRIIPLDQMPGTTQKCMACNKTVYLVDRLAADNRIYHKACFRCFHCKGTLMLSNFCSFEGVLYCRPHYDQLFKRTGSLDKSFEGTPKILKPEKPVDPENASKVSSFFAGTKDKCVGCTKTVYPIEKVSVNGSAYHRSCFKCTYGGCTISPSNYIAHEGRLYCKHHHIQLFKEKGNYSQLEMEAEEQQPLPAAASVEVSAES